MSARCHLEVLEGGKGMSADNYVYVKHDGTIWMGFVSDIRSPDVYGHPLHKASTFQNAVEWAHKFCAEEVVEYGVVTEKGGDEDQNPIVGAIRVEVQHLRTKPGDTVVVRFPEAMLETMNGEAVAEFVAAAMPEGVGSLTVFTDELDVIVLDSMEVSDA